VPALASGLPRRVTLGRGLRNPSDLRQLRVTSRFSACVQAIDGLG
jgi:hypothetical protein